MGLDKIIHPKKPEEPTAPEAPTEPTKPTAPTKPTDPPKPTEPKHRMTSPFASRKILTYLADHAAPIKHGVHFGHTKAGPELTN